MPKTHSARKPRRVSTRTSTPAAQTAPVLHLRLVNGQIADMVATAPVYVDICGTLLFIDPTGTRTVDRQPLTVPKNVVDIGAWNKR
jgi:hypothetical protein